MAALFRLLLLSSTFLSIFLSSNAQSCKSYTFSANKIFSACSDLPFLNSFLHWDYDPSSGKLQIAYRHTGVSSSRWVAWAINPNSTGMVGAQALVAYRQSSGAMRAYTAPVAGYQTQLQEAKLSFGVSDLSATYSNNEITIFATLQLPDKNPTLNQVWQDGPLSGDSPARHEISGANVLSAGSLNILSAQAGGTAGAGNSRNRKRNIHGVLNAVSWGTLMPIGVIIARYLRVFPSADPTWFYLHVGCQSSAYIIGVAGWATGIKLGGESSGVRYTPHRTIGIILFCFGTLQVFALLLRPKKDHKYRVYWNIYHHTVGYAVIILSIINIFKGFDILDPEKKWKNAYISILVLLAFAAVLLEAYTWYVVVKRKKMQEGGGKMSLNKNAENNMQVHGYGVGPQNGV